MNEFSKLFYAISEWNLFPGESVEDLEDGHANLKHIKNTTIKCLRIISGVLELKNFSGLNEVARHLSELLFCLDETEQKLLAYQVEVAAGERKGGV